MDEVIEVFEVVEVVGVVGVVEVRKVSQIGRSCRFGMVWYELNIVNESINDRGRYIAARASKNILGKCRLRKYTVEIQFGNIQFGNKNFIYIYF